jgi:hypothetical protein
MDVIVKHEESRRYGVTTKPYTRTVDTMNSDARNKKLGLILLYRTPAARDDIIIISSIICRMVAKMMDDAVAVLFFDRHSTLYTA